MLSLRKILVPSDFSELSKQALPIACDMAKAFGAKIVLVHVIPPSTYPVANVMRMRHFPNIQEEVHKRVQDEMAELAASLAPEVDAETLILEGIPSSEIVNAVGEHAVDMIVVCTHGHTGLKHALLGSTTERIVRAATCPVLTVKAKSS